MNLDDKGLFELLGQLDIEQEERILKEIGALDADSQHFETQPAASSAPNEIRTDESSTTLHRVEMRTFEKLGLVSAGAESSSHSFNSGNETWGTVHSVHPVHQHRANRANRANKVHPGHRMNPVSKRKWITLASAAAIIVIIAAGVLPGPASAALKRLLEYIPGVGIVQQTQGRPNTYVLKSPQQATYEGQTITVSGVMLSPKAVMVKLLGHYNHSIGPVKLTDAKGQTINLSSGSQSWAGGGAGWNGEFGYQGTVNLYSKGSAPTQDYTVVIGKNPSVSIPVTLTLAKSASKLSQFGPTDTKNDVTIAAVPGRSLGKASLTFLDQHPGNYRIMQFSDIFPGVTRRTATVVDRNHQTYTLTPVPGFGNNFTFKPAKGILRYRVTIPAVVAQYPDSARVTLPVPVKGSAEKLSKTVTLAGLPITFTSVEWVKNGQQDEVRYNIDLHAHLTDARFLQTFYVGRSSSSQLDPQTGAFEYIQVSASKDQRTITLHLTQPNVVIMGPWSFNVTFPQKTESAPG